MPGAQTFRSLFGWLMGLVAMTWVWAVALIMAWPWEKNIAWEPDFPLVATCADNFPCSIPYALLETARLQGRYSRLLPPEPVGEIQETDAWLRWKTVSGSPWQIEVGRSSWNFETVVRYRFDESAPVLVEVKRYDVRVLFYAFPLALVMVGGMFLRSLREGA